LGAFPLNLGTFEWNESDKSTSGSVFGLAKSKAIFREGLGCTLVREISEVEIRRAKTHVDLNRPVLNDTVYWPRGKKLADTVSHDLDMKKLNFAISSAFENTNIEIPANTRSVLVVYKGQLILEQYADGFDKDAPQLGWSMAKSVTNMLYGVMTKKGWIDVNDPAPVHEWRNDNRAAITSDQLLRMSSGLYWEEVYSSVSTATNMLYRYSNMGDFALGQPLHTKPEQEWVYSSGSTNILSKIIRDKIDSSSYYHFAQDELFSKIGITTAIIEPDAAGTFVGSSYMWASARDWARLGMLYLNNGEWYGEQIIDPEWVKYTVTPTPKAAAGEYGSQWWLNAGEKGNENNRILPNVPTDMYMMDGYEGQRVFVVPSFDLVVVRLGQNKKGGFDYDGFLSSIISCIDK
ncbi:MAG: CubicO group peptidase (beta-lactamase class C family), partial [Salibacteraceae bacterium]